MQKKKRSSGKQRKKGLPPGTLVYTGSSESKDNKFLLHKYTAEHYVVYTETKVKNILKQIDTQKNCWLQVKGINQVENIRKIGENFHINPLVLEDILDVSHRPKCNIFKEHLFFTLKALSVDEENGTSLQYHQISFLLADHLLITFQEKEEDWLKNLTLRLESNNTSLRNKPIDYLFYRIIDTIVDYYLVKLEDLEEQIENLELEINERIDDDDLQQIQKLKRDLITLRKNISPLRGAISVVRKEEQFLSETVIHNMSDVYEHTIHIIETIETYRELSSGLMDLYMTGTSNRMNEVMKVLTIIATIFIPLTFIAGVYGMNFKFMPELDLKWAYPATILLMLIVAMGMVLYFRRKKWL